jgi:5,8-dihydroxy-2-naphthoate synthase
MQKYTLGFSPCPNDCFIFDAIVNGRIDTEGLEFEPVITDVEELNQKAFSGQLDITKLSFHAYAFVSQEYVLLSAGSAIGEDCGPILISKNDYSGAVPNIDNFKIAIPGRYTTANLLLGLYAPNAKDKVEMLFSEIEDAVLDGKVEAGVIIHENRFTYEANGLHKIVDLGEFYEEEFKEFIPLGAIAVRRNIPDMIKQKINSVIKNSVEYAMTYPSSSMEFIKDHSQELDIEVIRKHIDLYVNNMTIDFGMYGRDAIRILFKNSYSAGLIPKMNKNMFIGDRSEEDIETPEE